MLIRTVSDLHLEFIDNDSVLDILSTKMIPHMKSDKETILVLCGDIVVPNKFSTNIIHKVFEELSNRFYYVLYVSGNHEYYQGTIEIVDADIQVMCSNFDNVIYLMQDTIDIGEYTFWGDTFWAPLTDNTHTNNYIANTMNDFRCIKTISDEDGKDRLITTVDFKQMHQAAEYKLSEFVENNPNKNIVVVTHHAPHHYSNKNNYRLYAHDTCLNTAYCSDMSELLLSNPNIIYWLHGHTHISCNYVMGNASIISNPHGYYKYDQNRNFDPKLIF